MRRTDGKGGCGVFPVAPRDLIPKFSRRFVKNPEFDDFVVVRYEKAHRPPASTILDAPASSKAGDMALAITRLSRIGKLQSSSRGTALTPPEMSEIVRLVNVRVGVERDLPRERRTYKHLRPLRRVAFRHGSHTSFSIGHADGRRKRGFTLAEANDIVDLMNFVLGHLTVNAQGKVMYTP